MTTPSQLLAEPPNLSERFRFVPARYFTRPETDPTRGRRAISLIVLHSAEAPDKPGKAFDVAQWFAGWGASEPQASAHYVVDAGEVVQCVLDRDIAWGAPGANSVGLQVELVGYAGQPFSAELLNRAAGLVAVLCTRYAIPARAVDVAGLLNRLSGITTHAAVSYAFRKSTHTDPGPGFPLDYFVARVGELVRAGRAA